MPERHDRHTVQALPATDATCRAVGARLWPTPPTDAYDAVSDRLRMEQNLGALIAVVLIVTLGAWLIDRLAAYSRTMACIDAGHRNCVPLDIQQPRPW